MVDVSATGCSITVKTGARRATITRFSDEGTPFEFNEIEVTGSALSLNGELILWAKPVAYAASVTVIPGTREDEQLRKMLEDAHVRRNGSSTKAVSASDCNATLVFTCPGIETFKSDGATAGGNKKTYTYSNGRIVSGPTAPSASAEGKLSSRTYTFVFEQYSES